MANEEWAPPSDAALDVDAPIRSVDITAIRDLTAAAFRGAPNSPTLSPWAMARAPVTAGDVTMFKDPVTIAKSDYNSRSGSENVDLTGALVPVHFVMVMNDGTVRVKWVQGRAKGTSSGGPIGAVGRVRAGVYTLLSSEITNSNNGLQESKSYDATIEPGDTIVWLLRSSTGGQMMQAHGFELATDGELLHPLPAFFTFGAEPT